MICSRCTSALQSAPVFSGYGLSARTYFMNIVSSAIEGKCYICAYMLARLTNVESGNKWCVKYLAEGRGGFKPEMMTHMVDLAFMIVLEGRKTNDFSAGKFLL